MIKKTFAFAAMMFLLGAVYVLVGTYVLDRQDQAEPTTTLPLATVDVIGGPPNKPDGDSNDGGDNSDDTDGSEISNFEECAAAGNPIAESYPPQCHTSNGKSFTQDIGNELDKQDLITIAHPRPTANVLTPLNVTGEARGSWFFEASFPVKLVDQDGTELANAAATTPANWMTSDFIPFTATIEFVVFATTDAKLILEKSNPSGLSEQNDSLIVPLRLVPSD